MYARRLTKSELMENGITNVTTDGHVFKGVVEEIPNINNGGYFVHDIYDTDENGDRIKIMNKNSAFGYQYKVRSLGLHRLMWAWHYGEVPEGMVVDHINNCHDTLEDYHLDNLQLLTPAENLAKERPNWNTRELKCKLNKPRSFYENKLEKFLKAYEQAKKDKDATAAHHYRTNVAQIRARLRYYDNHIAEYLEKVQAMQLAQEAELKRKAALKEIAAKRKELKLAVSEAHRFFTEARDAYGRNDEVTLKRWGEWKLAIAMYHGFCAEVGNDA